MSTGTTHLRQVVVYVEDDIYQRLVAIKGTDRRLSLSYIGERLFREALPAVEKQLMQSFTRPTQEPRGKKPKAA